ncbi:MAG: HYR domain-containing protein, partial [Saprospiraceae bacterium]|nr:HYR domain-containing protein [Saprospiraceae bacterium]
MKFFLHISLSLLTIALPANSLMAQCDPPIINNITPNSGFIGSTVTINGANFGNTPGDNTVFFGAAKATVLTASFAQLTVKVPVGANTALVSVKNDCDLIGYSRVPFNGLFCETPLTNTTYNSTEFSVANPGGAYNMSIADFDLDGKPDPFTGSLGNQLNIARNNSTPGALNFVITTINTPGSTRGLAVADIDADGKLDIVFSGDNGTYVVRNISSGPGNIAFAAAVQVSNQGVYQCGVGDFNNDGKVDICSGGGNNMFTYRNTSTGPGVVTFVASTTVNTGGTCNGIMVSDVDGDGNADIMGSHFNNNRMVSLRNTTPIGDPTFTFEAPEYWNTNGSGGSNPYRCAIADFDTDGKIDFTTCNYVGGSTAILRNTSVSGNISFAAVVTLVAPNSNYRIGVGDANGDGFTDIITKSAGTNVWSIYENTSTGPGNINFAARIDYNSSALAEVSGILIGDMDGDLLPDVATSGIGSQQIRFHRNKSGVPDVDPPTALCKDITVGIDASGMVTVLPEDVDNGSSDACGLDYMEINGMASIDYTCADLGTHMVTLTVYDLAGNSAECIANVTVDEAAITINGPSTVCEGETVDLESTSATTYQWKKDGVNIPGANAQTYTVTETGNYSVYVTNTMGCDGESAQVLITVNDSPTVTTMPTGACSLCPPTGTLTITASLSALYQWKKNGVDLAGETMQSITVNTPGNYTVEVVDLFGCSAVSAPAMVAMNDDIPPVISGCPADISVCEGSEVTWVEPTASDNCGIASFTSNYSPGDDFPIGITTVTYLATDNSGNTAECEFQVEVKPTWVNCPEGVTFTVSLFPGTCTGGAIWSIPVTYDECGATVTQTGGPALGDILMVGTYNIEYTATLPDGGTATCNFTIEVIDTEDPVIVCPANCVVEDTDPGECSWTSPAGCFTPLMAQSNCDATISWTVENPDGTTDTGVDDVSGYEFQLGTSTVTYKITETSSGEMWTCSFTVTVEDHEKPTIDCPADVNVVNDPGVCGAVVDFDDPTISDNCGFPILGSSVTFDYTGAAQTWTVPAGVTSIDVEVIGAGGGNADACGTPGIAGNGGKVMATIAVTPGETLTLYVGGAGTAGAAGLAGLGGYNGGGDGQALASQGQLGGGGGGASDIRQGGAALANRVVVGAGGGGGASCACQPGVGGDGGDLSGQTTGPDCAGGSGGGGGTQLAGGAGGNLPGWCMGEAGGLGFGGAACDGSGNGINAGGGGGGGFYGGGGGGWAGGGGGSSYTTPGATNVVHIQGFNSGNGQIIISYSGSNPLSQVSGLPSGSEFPVGVTHNVFVAEDAAGNTSSCSFSVTVSDNEDPELTCPQDVDITTSNLGTTGDCAGQYSWSHPIPDENCSVGGYFVTYTNPDGTIDGPYDLTFIQSPDVPFTIANRQFELGETTIHYYVLDASGNTGTCEFSVTVTDDEDPTFVNCPEGVTFTVGLFNQDCQGSAIWSIPIADDNCNATVTQTDGPDLGSILLVGAHQIQYTAEDAAGNTATCNFTIEVVDTEDPVIVCPGNVVIGETDPGVCTWTSPTGSLTPLLVQSNCPATVTWEVINPDGTMDNGSDDVSGYEFQQGTSTVTYTIEETASGQTWTCSFTVTVEDNEAPVIECPADINVVNDPGVCGAVVTFDDPIISDNCALPVGMAPVLNFTTAGASGTTGPSQAQVDAAYAGSPLDGQVTVIGQGIQQWTVPVSGVYSITAVGASGGFTPNAAGGKGRSITTEVSLTAGDVLEILVGQEGGRFEFSDQGFGPGYAGGGGGGSFIIDQVSGNPILIAAGGGGAGEGEFSFDGGAILPGVDASPFNSTNGADGIGYSGSWDSPGTGGTAGNGGTAVWGGSGGAGFNGNGQLGFYGGFEGISYTNGGLGGANIVHAGSLLVDISGGFGGGAGAGAHSSYEANGGGGGGYSGGGGSATRIGAGGGGGNYYTGTYISSDDNVGHGFVSISLVGGGSNPITQIEGLPSGSLFPVGTTTNIFVLTDAAGNTSTCSFDVTVTDNENPEITCPADVAITSSQLTVNDLGGEGDCLGTYEWEVPIPSDNCGIVHYSVTYINPDGTIDGPTDAFVFTPGNPANITGVNPNPSLGTPMAVRNFELGTTTITYFIEDSAGNTASCDFTVTVTDDEDPTFVNCPEGVTFTVGLFSDDCQGGAIWSIPIADDNCGATVSQTDGPLQGAILGVGTYAIQYTATDDAQNTATCNFTIEVIDTEDPVIVCPGNVVIDETDPGVCTWTSPA